MFFEEIGVLTRLNLINTRLAGRLFGLPIIMTWEKTKPLVDGIREYLGESGICAYLRALPFTILGSIEKRGKNVV
jgi:hypothetical protein